MNRMLMITGPETWKWSLYTGTPLHAGEVSFRSIFAPSGPRAHAKSLHNEVTWLEDAGPTTPFYVTVNLPCQSPDLTFGTVLGRIREACPNFHHSTLSGFVTPDETVRARFWRPSGSGIFHLLHKHEAPGTVPDPEHRFEPAA
ncbi:MAG: hypothetical protein U1G08_02790 [Verrucomicrobiota bacterium]